MSTMFRFSARNRSCRESPLSLMGRKIIPSLSSEVRSEAKQNRTLYTLAVDGARGALQKTIIPPPPPPPPLHHFHLSLSQTQLDPLAAPSFLLPRRFLEKRKKSYSPFPSSSDPHPPFRPELLSNQQGEERKEFPPPNPSFPTFCISLPPPPSSSPRQVFPFPFLYGAAWKSPK